MTANFAMQLDVIDFKSSSSISLGFLKQVTVSVREAGRHFCKVPLKRSEDDEEETEEVTPSL